jgi:hypothetical protein
MYQLTSEVWLDQQNECYKKVIVITPPPKEPALIAITKLLPRVRLSPFKERSPCCPNNNCLHVVMNPNSCCEMLCVENLVILFNYLVNNGFNVDTNITKIMFKSDVQLKNLICFIK